MYESQRPAPQATNHEMMVLINAPSIYEQDGEQDVRHCRFIHTARSYGAHMRSVKRPATRIWQVYRLHPPCWKRYS